MTPLQRRQCLPLIYLHRNMTQIPATVLGLLHLNVLPATSVRNSPSPANGLGTSLTQRLVTLCLQGSPASLPLVQRKTFDQSTAVTWPTAETMTAYLAVRPIQVVVQVRDVHTIGPKFLVKFLVRVVLLDRCDVIDADDVSSFLPVFRKQSPQGMDVGRIVPIARVRLLPSVVEIR